MPGKSAWQGIQPVGLRAGKVKDGLFCFRVPLPAIFRPLKLFDVKARGRGPGTRQAALYGCALGASRLCSPLFACVHLPPLETSRRARRSIT